MKNEEAKFLLQAYRPNGQDAEDPRFTEALEQARSDPDLLAWFNRNRALDAAVAAKLQSVPVPVDLKTSLVAGRKVVHVPESFWRQPRWVAVAALVLLMAVVGGLMIYQRLDRPSFASFQRDLPLVMSSFTQLEKQTPNLPEVRDWLKTHAGHHDLKVPTELEGVPSIGCRMLEWQGRPVTLVCFRVNRPTGQAAHLLVLDAREIRSKPGARPVFAQQEKWSTAAWTTGDHVYLLATDTGGSTVQEILGRSG